MKYSLDRMLPLNAFQGRGTPVGGRALRLWGYDEGGNWVATGDEVSDPNLGVAVPDNSGGWTAPAAAPLAAPESAAAPVDTPAAAPADSGGGGGEPAPAAAPASAPLAPANPWEQTINDIYQQTLGRQADPSGMATFTAALNAGMTGEQMRAALASSPEGQSMGLSPAPAALVAPLTAAKTAQWEWQPGTTDDSSGMGMSSTTAPYWLDVNSGAIKAADPVQYTGVTPVDTNTLPIQTAPNYEGTPTQFYDAQGNLQGVLVDTVKAGLGAKEGSLILDPTSLGLALKPGETPSINSAIQQRNEQGQMLFIDPTTGGTTIYNTGVPALTGSTVKDLMYINDPGPRGSIVPADVTQGMIMLAAAMATGGVGGALLDAAGFGAGAASGLGTAAGTGTGLTASEAASLMGGTLSDAGAASTLGGTVADAGINWGAAATAAAQTAAINAAVTVAQGGDINDALKAGALGAVTGGAGVAGADLLGGGTLAQIGAQTAVATATAAATGKDPVQAALSGALTATLANVVPAGTTDVLNGAGITDPSIQKAVNSAISSSVITAIRGGDIGTAAIMGAVNSGLTSVAGMIGNSQVVQDLKASIGSTIDETIASVKEAVNPSGARDNPEQQSAGVQTPPLTQPDVVNSILQQDAQDAMNRNLPPPPLVQNAIDQNTPPTLANVVTPPLIQQATGQSDPNAIYNQLVANYGDSTVGAPLSTLVSATTSDVNPIAVTPNAELQNALRLYNEMAAEEGLPQRSLDDPEVAAYLQSTLDRLNGVSDPAVVNDLYAIAGPKLSQEAYDPAFNVLQNAGIPMTATNIEDYAQNPAILADKVYQGFYGRAPTVQEADTIAYQINEMGVSPNDIIKNVYDDSKQVALLEQPPLTPAPAAQTPPVTTTTPPLTPAEPVKTPTASASSSSSGDTKPAGGLGTQGAAAAGNEGAPGAVSPSGAAALTEAQNIVSQAASANDIAAVDIPIDTQMLVSNSAALGTSPAQAVASGLVNPDGSLTAKGVKQISDATGLSPSDVVALTNASTTARTDTGSGITSTGAGATTGAATGATVSGTGIGGSTGTNIGGLGTGTGTGVGPGAGTGTGDGSGDGLGLGLGSGSGTGTSGAGTGGVKAAAAPAIAQPSYSYSGAGSQGTTVGALPGNLKGTFLQGVNVNEYNPFENYDKYQQLAPIHAAQGGSPLQLAQMQQGIAGVDPSLYNVLQKRQAPNYFTYGQDTSGGNPTTFAGSQLLGKPTPNIPVIPTGQKSGSDWLYQGSGTNPLAMAGTGIPSLGAGTMAHGGQAHDGGEGEHIPEFITGATGHYVKGRGDGQSDDIPAMLADGEYVFDAETVAQLGNGSSDAGAAVLDKMREAIRHHKRSAPIDSIPPKSKSPLEYLAEATKGKGKHHG